MSLSQIVPLAEGQIESVARVMARAFQDGPIPLWMFPDPAERAAKLPLSMQLGVRCGYHFGEVFTTAGEARGAAVWFPPDGWDMTPQQMTDAGLGLDELAGAFGPEAMEKLTANETFEAELHHQHMPDPHWFLALLGVEPAYQRQGLGRALIEPVLARADVEGLPCYLGTERERNVDFYRKLGFEVVLNDVEPTSGIEFWTMQRPPAD